MELLNKTGVLRNGRFSDQFRKDIRSLNDEFRMKIGDEGIVLLCKEKSRDNIEKLLNNKYPLTVEYLFLEVS